LTGRLFLGVGSRSLKQWPFLDIENVAGLILVWIELVGHKRTGIRRETAAIQLKELGAACPDINLILTSLTVKPPRATISLPGRPPQAGVLYLTKEHNS
jgi:hypothetical protein